MKLKGLILSASLAIVLSASALCGIVFYKNKIDEKRIDLSAFYNLSKNIENLNSENKERVETKNENAEIVALIEKEISIEIIRLRKVATNEATTTMKKKRIVLEKKILPAKKRSLAQDEIKDDLSSFEINNKDMIKTSPIKIENINIVRFQDIHFDEVAIEDRVENNQAATTRELSEDEKKEDELVVFDYERKPPEKQENKLYDRPISNNVKKAISRELGSYPVTKTGPLLSKKEPTPTTVTTEEDAAEEQIIYDYSSEKKSAVENFALETDAEKELFFAENVTLLLNAREINLSTGVNKNAKGFDFAPDYDRNEILNDNSTGQVEIREMLGTEKNILTGTLFKNGFIPTRVELNLNTQNRIELPLVEEGAWPDDEEHASAVMVNLRPEVKDVELDKEYREKIFYDLHFKKTPQREAARYVIFSGVISGNLLIRYQLNTNEMAEKISYLGAGEMLFDDPVFENKNRQIFELEERPIMSSKRSSIKVAEEKIRFVRKQEHSKKKAIGAYEITVPTQTNTMRKYIQIETDNMTLLAGSGDRNKIEIPTKDYIERVLEASRVSSLRNNCVVQINLSKPLATMMAGGKNQKGEMYIEQSSIDENGNFNSDNYEAAEKIFLVGEEEGMFSVKLEYSNGSKEILKTFCKEGAYLVEQL